MSDISEPVATASKVVSWSEQLFDTWLKMVDFPSVVLLVILLLGTYVLWQTQRNADNNFDFADMLRDDRGKPSSAKLAVFVCLGITTWAVMYMLMISKGQIDNWIFMSYLGVWSGAKIVERALDAYMMKQGYMHKPNDLKRSTDTMDNVESVETKAGEESKSSGQQ